MSSKPVAVITGGASGIGLDTSRTLALNGWEVWCLDRNLPASTQDNAADPAHARFLECDVSDAQSVRGAFDTIRQHTDRVTALIQSAGVLRTGRLMDHAPEQVDEMLQVNLKAPWMVIREAHSLLKREAEASPSRIILLGSVSGIRPKVGSGFYAATKAALHALTGVLAVELAQDNILVNAVAPGTVNTSMIRAAQSAATGSGYKPSGTSPLGRIAEPEDVTAVILFFLSDTSRYVTGTVLPVDGGTRAAFKP